MGLQWSERSRPGLSCIWSTGMIPSLKRRVCARSTHGTEKSTHKGRTCSNGDARIREARSKRTSASERGVTGETRGAGQRVGQQSRGVGRERVTMLMRLLYQVCLIITSDTIPMSPVPVGCDVAYLSGHTHTIRTQRVLTQRGAQCECAETGVYCV